MKATELRSKSKSELQQELDGLLKEQFSLRMQKGSGQLGSPARFNAVRKDIARVKTVMNEMDATDATTTGKQA